MQILEALFHQLPLSKSMASLISSSSEIQLLAMPHNGAKQPRKCHRVLLYTSSSMVVASQNISVKTLYPLVSISPPSCGINKTRLSVGQRSLYVRGCKRVL